MAQVEIEIANHRYDIACGTGEEERVRQMAERFKQRIEQTTQQMPQASHALTLILTAIMMEDEIVSLREEKGLDESDPVAHAMDTEQEVEKRVQALLDPVAKRLEELAA